MEKVLETERTYLRKLSFDDAQNFFDLNSDKEVIKYTGDKSFENVDEAKSFLLNYDHYDTYGYGRWAVIEKKSDELIGWCGLKFNQKTEEIDLGFRFFKKYWNQGFATETAQACLQYGFNELKIVRIIGRAMTENKASISVLQKIGMQYIGKTTCSLHDAELFEIINSNE